MDILYQNLIVSNKKVVRVHFFSKSHVWNLFSLPLTFPSDRLKELPK